MEDPAFFGSVDSFDDFGLIPQLGYDPSLTPEDQQHLETMDSSFQWDDRKKRRRSRTF